MSLLRQSTAVTIQLGPFLDPSDGVTEETGLTPAVELSKAGATFAARGSSDSIAHDAEGWYRVPLSATDTGTLGRLALKCHDSASHLPVWAEFTVVPAAVYDALVAGTDPLQVAATLDGSQREALADALLARSVASCEATAAEHSLCTVILGVLESAASGSTWTIRRTDGSTPHLTRALTTDASAEPITGVG